MPALKHWWQVREKWSWDSVSAIIDREAHHEENLRVLERHAEMRWDRLRRRYGTKHVDPKHQMEVYFV